MRLWSCPVQRPKAPCDAAKYCTLLAFLAASTSSFSLGACAAWASEQAELGWASGWLEGMDVPARRAPSKREGRQAPSLQASCSHGEHSPTLLRSMSSSSCCRCRLRAPPSCFTAAAAAGAPRHRDGPAAFSSCPSAAVSVERSCSSAAHHIQLPCSNVAEKKTAPTGLWHQKSTAMLPCTHAAPPACRPPTHAARTIKLR